MDVSILDMAGQAIVAIADPSRFLYLCLGVLIGLALGVIPGLSGLIGLSLLLPFTYNMDPLAGLAMLIGLASVTTTSDTIPAVLFGVPGTVGSAATTLDGHPMAKKGEANRAFGAAFAASMFGGVFGALLLGLSVPILRPIMLMIGTPELLAFCLFGLSLVAVLSGNNAFKGLAAACIGLLLAMVGQDSQAGEMRWTFDTIYLWDGMPIVPVALGLFALPELADLAIRRTTIVAEHYKNVKSTQMMGVRDVLRNKFLVLRCASIGSLLGAVPGIGAAVIDWIAYAHAARTVKGASQTFGKGDVRGVIASESSNNAKEGGALVPTIAFGVPGSASMALILGAFTVHGIVPGPRMLTTHLDVTYALVWSVAIANVLAAGICFAFANQLSKLALLRASILVPVVLAIAFIGAFQGQKDWGDLILLIGTGILGFVMKRLGWPRPPVILGFVLGALVERYMAISVLRYGASWLLHPVVVIMLVMAVYGLLGPSVRAGWKSYKTRGSQGVGLQWSRPLSNWDFGFAATILAVFTAAFVTASVWPFGARLFPQIITIIGSLACAWALISMVVRRPAMRGNTRPSTAATDLIDELTHLARPELWKRAVVFFAWCGFYLGISALIGMLPAMAVFLFGYIRFSGKEKTWLAALIALATTAFCYVLFHLVLMVPWPNALLGDLFPALRSYTVLDLF